MPDKASMSRTKPEKTRKHRRQLSHITAQMQELATTGRVRTVLIEALARAFAEDDLLHPLAGS
jgi:hypothetical protein